MKRTVACKSCPVKLYLHIRHFVLTRTHDLPKNCAHNIFLPSSQLRKDFRGQDLNNLKRKVKQIRDP